MGRENYEIETINPEQIVLNSLQQKRMAIIANEKEDNIAGKNIVQLSEQLKWRVDPYLFFFKKICGKVVKKDPVTGEEYPVPFATVYVEDTDCNFLIYHPLNYPWSWHFPLFCHRETLATVQTDACGNFCAWVPRFDIDWILRWRRERYCFPVIFKRPILKDLVEQVIWPPNPNPPDPPFKQFEKLSTVLNSIGGDKAEMLKRKFTAIETTVTLGTTVKDTDDSLNERLFDHEMPPPLHRDYQKALSGNNVIAARGASVTDAIRANIAEKLGLDAAGNELEGFDLGKYAGPFYRCVDIIVPEWQIVFDVPDITFRVTQDTNGDGIEETIYSESYFDVRWDDTDTTDVKLIASSIAKESRACHVPSIPCGDVPDLLFAGMMSLRNPDYFDANAGYATRPNMPRPSGTIPTAPQTNPPVLSFNDYSYPASTPFCGTVLLNGCVEVGNAVYYRISQRTDLNAPYSPITNLGWNNFVGSTPIPITADANGWYPVQPLNPVTLAAVPRASLEFPNLLLEWPTPYSETTQLIIELGDGAKNKISESAPVTIVTDNTRPVITPNTLAWKYSDEADAAFRNLDILNCPMIKRGVVARGIEVIFDVMVSAVHLRDAALSTSGCGDGAFAEIADVANNPAHWHTAAMDNTVLLHQRYSLAATSKPGCYTFTCIANERSMNPDGGDGGDLLPTDWYYNPVYLQAIRQISVAVVNEDLS